MLRMTPSLSQIESAQPNEVGVGGRNTPEAQPAATEADKKKDKGKRGNSNVT